MAVSLWQQCIGRLQDELSAQQFSMWIRPLQAEMDGDTLVLYAPNRFVLDWVRDKYINIINQFFTEQMGSNAPKLRFDIGSRPSARQTPVVSAPVYAKPSGQQTKARVGTSFNTQAEPIANANHRSNINPTYQFDNFVEGKSNQLGKAAALQVSENPGGAYNPLFLYGGTGLGKTHLLHAVGNGIIKNNPNAKVVYMHSERFVQDMVKALQNNAIEEFKRYYRSVDALFIDDIQFFANKDRSQEEFFHTFNALLEGNHQIILTSDRYPKEIDGVEDRLKSRFGWGLTVAIEPPELETRVAILMRKAQESGINLPDEVAFFIAKRLRSNVRELEGAIISLIAQSSFNKKEVTLDLAKNVVEKFVKNVKREISIEYIQKVVSDYFQLDLDTLQSKTRKRHVVQARQLAMFFAKKFTKSSLANIGSQIGDRDHATVLHACKTVDNLVSTDKQFRKFVDDINKKLTL